jgi:hypothetical protein
MCSLSLGTLGRRGHQLGTENPIPEPTGHAEAIFEVGEVVLEVVLLEVLVVRGETGNNVSAALEKELRE